MEKTVKSTVVEHSGITVFHTYPNDDDQPSTYFYTTHPNNAPDQEEVLFDIRDLPQMDGLNRYCTCCHKAALKAAIDAGEMPPKEKEVKVAEPVPTTKKVAPSPGIGAKRGRPKGSKNKPRK